MKRRALAKAVLDVRRLVKPPPDLTISEWSNEFRYLSSESAAEPGKYRTARVPYQSGPMDALCDPGIHTLVLMWAAQSGKTTIIENIIGYYIDQDPSPILMVQPTVSMAQTFSKTRLSPMLRDTPVLRGKVADPKSRDSGNTIEQKSFPGGHITLTGANAPGSLAQRPIRIVLMDEVDRYPASAGTEGDPVALATKRTAAFYNRKIILTSTPGIKGFSRIEQAYHESDQRRYHVPCPACGVMHPLEWCNLYSAKGEDGHRIPEQSWFICPACGGEIREDKKPWILSHGEWLATATPKNPGVVGFHLTEDYSPFRQWAEIVRDHQLAKDHPETLKTWTNTSRAETWQEVGDTHDPTALFSRREHFDIPAPEGVMLVTAGVDVQKDRWEIEYVGWGYGEESWSLGYDVIYGDTSRIEDWVEYLEPSLAMTFKSRRGTLAPECILIDAGYRTETVYKFSGPRAPRKIYASHGKDGSGLAVVHSFKKPTRDKSKKPPVVIVGVDTCKDLLSSFLNVNEPGPAFCHFPLDRDHEYFEMLTAETRKTRYKMGHQIAFWELPAGQRNEALDCRNYAFAALRLLNVNWDSMKKTPVAKKSRPSRKSGFVGGWRK